MEIQIAVLNSHHGVTVKDVPARDFIEAFAKHLKKGSKIKMPAWAKYYKTSCANDMAPYDDDWLYTRAASVAYQLYMRGKVGVNTLRKHYSGKKRYGTRTEHTCLVAGKNIRYCLQQLESAGLVGRINVENDDGNTQCYGKTLTKKGMTDMDRIASQVSKNKKQ